MAVCLREKQFDSATSNSAFSIPILNVYLNCFAHICVNFEAKRARNVSKNKNVLDLHQTFISGLGGSVLSKTVKVAMPYCTILYTHSIAKIILIDSIYVSHLCTFKLIYKAPYVMF